MPALTPANEAIWLIAALATFGVLMRPWGWSEAIWAVAGACLLGVTALLPLPALWSAVARGTNVYLFLAGMMLLAELAREQGLFEWLAALAARAAGGSARRLFVLVYVVGIVVTMTLSNDATAVVLTPAVCAVARVVGAPALPYLFICAFIANAASFLLPISNPANLVVFANHLPPLDAWLARFAWPAATAILVTFVALGLSQRRALAAPIAREVPRPRLSVGSWLAAAGILATVGVLLGASARGRPLGLPTLIAGAATVLITLACQRRSPWRLVAAVSWSILPLVAGLFVLVAGLEQTGLLTALGRLLQTAARSGSVTLAAGLATAIATNLANNLPIALIAGHTLAGGAAARPLADALLIGVDLGPNLSLTGSLATLLWLAALRREGEAVGAGRFLRLGLVVMLPALVAALLVIELLHG